MVTTKAKTRKINAIDLLVKLANLDRVKFIALHNYENAAGEVSNYTLIAAYKYAKAVQKDIERLSGVCYTGHKEVARVQMLDVLIRNQDDATRTAASWAQINAYVPIAMHSKLHEATGNIRIWAFLRSKKTLQSVPQKKVNKGMMEQLKDEIRRELRMSTPNFRLFKLETITEAIIEGTTLKIVA